MQAVKKAQLVAAGKLGKYGKILDTTPADVRAEFGNNVAAKTTAGGDTSVSATPQASAAAATPQTVAVSSRKVC